jgi:hypothetical protein
MPDFFQRFLRLGRSAPPVESPLAPAAPPESGLSLPSQFAWYLFRRSRSARLIEFDADRSELTLWHADWPPETLTGCPPPDATPVLSLRRQPGKPSRLDSALKSDPLAQSVVRLSGLDRFPRSAPPLETLRRLSQTARYLILEANASSTAFETLCRELCIPPAFVTDAPHPVALAGREAAPPPAGLPPARALALMTTCNEEDIIEQCVQRLFDEGLDVFVVDDNSTDATVEKLDALARSSSGRLTFDRDSRRGARYYDRQPLLSLLLAEADRAATRGVEWMLFTDADEIRTSPWPGVPLAQAFAQVESLGCNAVDFTVADFRYLRHQRMTTEPFEQQLRHFEFGRRPGHFLQIKAWRHPPGLQADLFLSRGHEVTFENRRVFPLKFLLRHYPLRGEEHARKKIHQDRFPRYHPEEVAKGAHVQYNPYRDRVPDGWDPDRLQAWDDSFPSRFLLERLSGIGIGREI